MGSTQQKWDVASVAVMIVMFALMMMGTIWSSPVDAHSGGTDKYGCHAGSQPRHCHPKPKPKVVYRSTSTSANDQLYKSKYFKCDKQMTELEQAKVDADETIEFLRQQIKELSMENAHLRGEMLGNQ